MLARVQEGNEVIAEQDHRPVAVIKTPPPGPGRKLSECIALAKVHEEELGYAPVPDPDFPKDVNRPPSIPAVSRSNRRHGISPRLGRAHRGGA